jgi:3-methyladenine DNA glycosylase AlkD
MKPNKILNEMHRAIKKAAHHKKPVPDTMFHKHKLYLHYGMYVPVYREIMKHFTPKIRKLTLRDRKELAMKLIKLRIGELSHAGIRVLTLSVDEFTPKDLNYINKCINYFCSWSQVDHLCGDVLRPLLYKYKKDVIRFCWKWTESKNRWKRRASIVVFTRFVGFSGKYTDIVIKLCEKLKWDKEDIVQKGVGWALKDNLKSKPKRIIKYVKKLRRQGIPSTITLYAIRDLKGKERKEILSIKKL